MHTLVIHTGGIGDFILACPAIAWIAREGPVTLAGQPGRLELAVAAGIAARAVDLDAIAFHSVFGEPAPRFLDAVRPFGRAVVFIRDDGAIAAAFRRAGLDGVRCIPGLPGASWRGHAAGYYLDAVGAPPGAAPALPLEPAPGPHDLLIHPGSGSPKKNWPLAHYAAVAAALGARGRRIGWILGPAERGLALPPGAEAVREPSLAALGRRLAACPRFLGNDSGIAHLAAAVGCPATVLFGPTDPTLWAPRGPRVTILQGNPWPTPEAVLEHLES